MSDGFSKYSKVYHFERKATPFQIVFAGVGLGFRRNEAHTKCEADQTGDIVDLQAGH